MAIGRSTTGSTSSSGCSAAGTAARLRSSRCGGAGVSARACCCCASPRVSVICTSRRQVGPPPISSPTSRRGCPTPPLARRSRPRPGGTPWTRSPIGRGRGLSWWCWMSFSTSRGRALTSARSSMCGGASGARICRSSWCCAAARWASSSGRWWAIRPAPTVAARVSCACARLHPKTSHCSSRIGRRRRRSRRTRCSATCPTTWRRSARGRAWPRTS